MLTTLTIADIQEWNKNYKATNKGFKDYYDQGEEDKMYAAFYYLLRYYSFKDNCIAALQQLKILTATENFLETEALKEWLVLHEWLGAKKLITFLVDNNIHEERAALEITDLNIAVELQPFIQLSTFCEIFQILYWELQLHLPVNERVFDETGHYYYYISPEPAEVRVKKLLGKL